MRFDNFIQGSNNVINTVWAQPSFDKEKTLSLYNKENNVINLSKATDFIINPEKLNNRVDVENKEYQSDKIIFYHEGDVPINIELPIGIEEITGEVILPEQNKFIIQGIKNNGVQEENLYEGVLSETEDMTIIIDEDGTINFNYASGLIEKKYFSKVGKDGYIYAPVGYKDFYISDKQWSSYDNKSGTATTQYGLGRIEPTVYSNSYINNFLLYLLSGQGKKEKIINNFTWYDCVLTNQGKPSHYGSEHYLINTLTPIKKTSEDIIIPRYLYGYYIGYIGYLDFEQDTINTLEISQNLKYGNKAFHNLNINTVNYNAYNSSSQFGGNSITKGFYNCIIDNFTWEGGTLYIGTEGFCACKGAFFTNNIFPNMQDIGFVEKFPFSESLFEKLEIENITYLGSYRNYGYIFGKCIKLNTINLPNLIALDVGDFYQCIELENIYLPKITAIPNYTFQGCTSLTGENITFSEELATIGQYAFEGCTSLKTLEFLNNIKGGLTYIDANAFKNCTSLIEISPKVYTIYGYAFQECINLLSITLPLTHTIYAYAFQGCEKLETIECLNLTSLNSYAFKDCTNLKKVNMPLITNIGSSAFLNCTSLNAEELTFSTELTTVGSYAFENCDSLTSLDFLQSNKNVTLNYQAFSKCDGLVDITIPSCVKTLGCFADCANLTKVDLSEVTTLTSGAFMNCVSLQEVSSSFITSLPYNCFNGCMFTTLDGINFIDKLISLETYAFANCTNLKEASFPMVKTVGSSAFNNCTALTDLNLPLVTSLASGALSKCTALENLNIASITSLPANYFQNYTNLKSIDISSLTTIPKNCFSKCSSLTGTNLFLSSNLTTVGISAFEDCISLTDLSFLESTQNVSLSNYTFRRCTGLIDVVLPNSVKTIAGGVFGFDTGIKTVLFPEVTTMVNWNFEDCIAMESFEAPKLLQMGTNTFHGCTSLKTVLMPSIITFGVNTFIECSSLETIDIASYAGVFPNTAFPDAAYNNFKEITNSKLTSMSGIVVANDFSLSNNQGLLNNFELASTGKVVINSLINTTSTTISLANATDITINNLNEEDTLGIVNLTLNENATALDINLKGIEPETMAAMITSNCTELRNYNYWTPLYLQSSTMVPFLSTGTYATPTATETYIELGEINEEGYMTGSIYTKYKNKVIYIPSTLEAEYLTQEYFSNLIPDVQHGYFTTQDTETGEWTDFVLVSTEKSTVKEDYGFGIITV